MATEAMEVAVAQTRSTKGMLWTVCGTGRSVGKTSLCRQLCSVLPSSIYAKLGHHPPKAGKQQNYFRTELDVIAFVDKHQQTHRHVVVEAHTETLRRRADLVVFIDGIPLNGNRRKDVSELRSQADLRVGPNASVREWKGVLRKRLSPHALREAVCDALAESQRHLLTPRLGVRSKVFFVAGDLHAFGSGLASLLESIDRCQSLADAAREDGISYRRAWNLLRNAETHTGRPLVTCRTGGAGGGQTRLSAHGRRMLDVYRRLSDEVAAYADRRFRLHFHGKERKHVAH